MMLSMVGLKRAFMASGLILSIPCEDHFTKSTLWGVVQEETSGEYINNTHRQRHKDLSPGRPAVMSKMQKGLSSPWKYPNWPGPGPLKAQELRHSLFCFSLPFAVAALPLEANI